MAPQVPVLQFNTVAQAGRYIWSHRNLGFVRPAPADEHVCFYRSVLAVASADGVLSQEEKSSAKAGALMNSLSLRDFDEMAADISSGSVQDAVREVTLQLQQPFEAFQKHGPRPIVYHSVLVAAQDGLEDAERKAAYEVGKNIGIPSSEIDGLVDYALKDCELLKEKTKLLFPNGSKYHTKPPADYSSIDEACRGYWAYSTLGMTETPPAELTTAMIKASLAVAGADDNLSAEESNMAKAAAIVTGMSSKEFDDFKAAVKASSDKSQMAMELLRQVPKEFQVAALYYSCYVAAVDGFDIKEMESIKKISSSLGISDSVTSGIMALTVKESELHKAKVAAMFPGNGPYDAE